MSSLMSVKREGHIVMRFAVGTVERAALKHGVNAKDWVKKVHSGTVKVHARERIAIKMLKTRKLMMEELNRRTEARLYIEKFNAGKADIVPAEEADLRLRAGIEKLRSTLTKLESQSQVKESLGKNVSRMEI